MSEEIREELKKFIGKELFVEITGKDFAPKGILNKVNDEIIVLGENRILISSIVSFQPARGGRR